MPVPLFGCNFLFCLFVVYISSSLPSPSPSPSSSSTPSSSETTRNLFLHSRHIRRTLLISVRFVQIHISHRFPQPILQTCLQVYVCAVDMINRFVPVAILRIVRCVLSPLGFIGSLTCQSSGQAKSSHRCIWLFVCLYACMSVCLTCYPLLNVPANVGLCVSANFFFSFLVLFTGINAEICHRHHFLSQSTRLLVKLNSMSMKNKKLMLRFRFQFMCSFIFKF